MPPSVPGALLRPCVLPRRAPPPPSCPRTPTAGDAHGAVRRPRPAFARGGAGAAGLTGGSALGVEAVEGARVTLLHRTALELERRGEVALLHGELAVDDLELLDRLPLAEALV